MKALHSRRFTRLGIGLTLAFVFALGVRLSADSGGFYCGYGDCLLTYDCENEDYSSAWHYTNMGNGSCRISVGIGPTNSCYVNLDTYGAWHWVDDGGGQNFCDPFIGGSFCVFNAEPDWMR